MQEHRSGRSLKRDASRDLDDSGEGTAASTGLDERCENVFIDLDRDSTAGKSCYVNW